MRKTQEQGDRPTVAANITQFVPAENIIGGIDSPCEGDRLTSDALQIVGWAYSPSGSIDRIDATLGDEHLGLLANRLTRLDVVQSFPNLNMPSDSGFWGEFKLPIGDNSVQRELVITVTNSAGHIRQWTLNVTIESPPFIGQKASPWIMGAIEEPREEHVIAGSAITVSGWAFAQGSDLESIEVYLGGTLLGAPTETITCQDVVAAFPGLQVGQAGFRGHFTIPDNLAHEQSLCVRVSDHCGHVHDLTRTICVEPCAVLLMIDSPVDGIKTSNAFTVRGWALSTTAHITSVDVLIGSRIVASCIYGLKREDVYDVVQWEGSLYSGFEAKAELIDGDYIGCHTLTIRATDELGNALERDVTIDVTSPLETLAAIERVDWYGRHLTVEGWALWPQDHKPQRVSLFLDGSPVGHARINRSRQDIVERFPLNPMAIQCGFHFEETVPLSLIKARTGLSDAEIHVLQGEFTDGLGHRIEAHCEVLYTPQQASQIGAVELGIEQYIAEFYEVVGRLPSLLDWTTDRKLASLLPEMNIFSPAEFMPHDKLPYFDRSVDIVVFDADAESAKHEAVRVARILTLEVVRAPAEAWVSEAGDETERDYARAQADSNIVPHWLDKVEREGKRPTVTIIIPVHNQIDFTTKCLAQVQQTLPTTFVGEILVVDDGSTDTTAEVVSALSARDPRIRLLRNSTDVGFFASCNRAAQEATGDMLVFLNNDTLPHAQWLPPLLRIFRNHPDAGAVGGKLLFEDSRLREAGGVVFAGGSARSFGRGDAAIDHPLYAHVRAVDYCSGALLATPRFLFAQLGGFDTRYQPAYYQDADYCFALRAHGYTVYYQPASVITHFQRLISGVDLSHGVKQYQIRDQAQFTAKWAEALSQQPHVPNADVRVECSASSDERSELRQLVVRGRPGQTKRVLLCAPMMPEFDHEGGSRRIFHVISMLHEAGWAVTFVASNARGAERYVRLLQQMGVETYVGRNTINAGDEYLDSPEALIGSQVYDLAILFYWTAAHEYLPLLRQFSPRTRVLIDSVDLNFLRRARENLLAGQSHKSGLQSFDVEYTKELAGELSAYAAADGVLAVSQKEADLIDDLVGRSGQAHVLPLLEDIDRSATPLEQRRGMVFLGSFRHAPNVDAVEYLCAEILPLLAPELLEAHPLTIIGHAPCARVIVAAQRRGMRLVGWVPEVEPYLHQARLMVVPLRYGAGTKTKLIQTMMAGTPAVSTSIGVEGLNLRHEVHTQIADDPETFAQGIQRLLTDDAYWHSIATHARVNAESTHGAIAVSQRLEHIVAAVMNTASIS